MKLWICRNLDNDLTLHYEKPTWYDRIECWSDIALEMNPFLFPEVTFENSPMEVELVLPSQEPTIGDLLNQLIEIKKEMRKFREMVFHMRHVQKNYTSYESMFDEDTKLILKRREADVDKWLRETEETEFCD